MQKRPEKPTAPRRALSAGECRRGMAMSGGFFLFSVSMLMDGPRGGTLAWMWPFLAVLHGSLFAFWANNYRRLRRGETVQVADNAAQAAVPRVVSVSAAALLRVVATVFTVASLWIFLEVAPRSPSVLLFLGGINVVAWWLVFHVQNRIAADAAATIPASETTPTNTAATAPGTVASSDPKRWWTADATREEIQQGNRR